MQITFLGQAGLFIETKHGSILCDPWFNPAYFASWFPFPSNEDVDIEKLSRPIISTFLTYTMITLILNSCETMSGKRPQSFCQIFHWTFKSGLYETSASQNSSIPKIVRQSRSRACVSLL